MCICLIFSIDLFINVSEILIDEKNIKIIQMFFA